MTLALCQKAAIVASFVSLLLFSGDRWDSEVRLMDKAVVAMNKLQPKPRFLCLGGDIVNAFPGLRRDVFLFARFA